MPRVSVLMPVYNAERYVGKAIESILAQTFRDFEFIIIDDGSTDRTASILREYAAKDRRIRLVRRPNTGYVVALNEMVAMASGEFLARMDSDDIAFSERLAVQQAYMQGDPECVCVGSAVELIDAVGRKLIALTPPPCDHELQAVMLKGHTPLCHPSVMMRAEAVRRVGGYDPEMMPAEDLDLFLRLGEVGSLACLGDVLLKYRLHAGSVSEQAGLKQRERAEVACRRAWHRRGIQGQFEAGDPWRPTMARGSRYEFALRYGWWAYNSGERRTAAIYGAKAVGLMPWRAAGWKLLARSMLGPGGGPADSSDSETDASMRPAPPKPELAGVARESGGSGGTREGTTC